VKEWYSSTLPLTSALEGTEVEEMYSSTLSLTSALDGGGWSMSRPSRSTPRKDPVPIVQEAGWAPGPVWTGAENLAPTGIRQCCCINSDLRGCYVACRMILSTFRRTVAPPSTASISPSNILLEELEVTQSNTNIVRLATAPGSSNQPLWRQTPFPRTTLPVGMV
jgi:hypothetical protein